MNKEITKKIDRVIEVSCDELLKENSIISAEDLKALAVLITARAELKTNERMFVSGRSNHNCC